MAHLADAMNTWDLALELIHKKGFSVIRHASDDPCIPSNWEASDEFGHTLIADSPLALLGLCDIWLEWGKNWKSAKVEPWYDKILELED